MQLHFRAYKAINELDTCLKFIEEHRNVLRDYNISNITTNTEEWMHNPNVYCVIAQDLSNNKIVGGLRIHISDGSSALPVELAIGRMDQRIHSVVENFRKNGGVAELCALWNAKAIAGAGVSTLLVRAGIAVSNQLEIQTLMCICADYTLNMFQNAGFIADHSLGLNGGFPYPNANYTARVLGIMNPHSLESANAFDRERMESLRSFPVQRFAEQGTNQKIDVYYNLVIVK